MCFNTFVWIIVLLKLGYLSHFKSNNNIMCKQIAMRWLFCNKVNTVLLITVGPASEEVTGTRKKGVTEIMDKMKKKKREVEGAVQKRTFNYFPRP